MENVGYKHAGGWGGRYIKLKSAGNHENNPFILPNPYHNVGFCHAGGAQSFLTNGLVAYYPFNGNANDASGNGYNGTVQGATLTTNRFGVASSAYAFNGSQSFIQLPETLFSPSNSAFTISLWVTTDSGNYANQTIMEKSPANGEMNFGISASGQFSFGANLCPPYNYQTIYTPMVSNAVTHIVGVYLEGKSIALYTNGILATNMSIPRTNLWQSGFPLNTALGIYDYTGGPYLAFRGHIEDVRVYTNALIASQVQQLYQYESIPPSPPPSSPSSFLTNGLVLYYPFSGNAMDASGNGNNGTVQGATLTTNRFSVTNGAYAFDGNQSRIQIPETIFGPTAAAFTISLWVTTDNNNYPDQDLFEKSPVNGEVSLGISSDQFSFGANLVAPYNYQAVYTPMISNAVTHLVAVYQQGQSVSLYTNGLLAATLSIPEANLQQSGFPLASALGIYDYTPGPYGGFRGNIEGVRVYTNALTASQVQQLYQYESPTFLTNGLVMYYPFSGNANDASGNGNNGTVQGATLTTNRFGVPNSAYAFNGIQNDVQFPDTIFGPTNAAVTVSMWVTTDNGSYSSPEELFEKGSMNGEMDMSIQANQFEFAPNLTSPYSWQNVSTPLTANSVTHLVGVYQQGQSVSLYTNGVLATNLGSIPNAALESESGYALVSALGIYDYTPGPYLAFHGQIEDVRVYTNALSSLQVQELYEYESVVPPLPPSITNEPVDVYVDPYETAAFTVGASGATPLTYQWLFDGSDVLNGTNNILTVSDIVQTNLGQYAVVVTNGYGAITSSIANLYMYPAIVDPFTGLVTEWGQTNTLSVGAWGSGVLAYQWYDNGAVILGATNATFTLSDIQFTNTGSYSVVVSSSLGSATNAAAQVVVNPAGFTLGLYPGITITGTVGNTYTIQSNPELLNSNGWTTLGTITLTAPVQLWVDTNIDASLPVNPRRFYRLVPSQ